MQQCLVALDRARRRAWYSHLKRRQIDRRAQRYWRDANRRQPVNANNQRDIGAFGIEHAQRAVPGGKRQRTLPLERGPAPGHRSCNQRQRGEVAAKLDENNCLAGMIERQPATVLGKRHPRPTHRLELVPKSWWRTAGRSERKALGQPFGGGGAQSLDLVAGMKVHRLNAPAEGRAGARR